MLETICALPQQQSHSQAARKLKMDGPCRRAFPWRSCAAWACGLLLAAMNFIRCFDNAFWGDEAFTVMMAEKALPDMIAATAADVHPPLYYIFVRLARLAMGRSGFTYHFASFLAYLIAMLLALTVIRKEMGAVTSAILMVFSSVSRSAVVYNVEARMYSWAALFVLLAYLGAWFILKRNSWAAWAGFTLSSLCAAYTHYYALVMVAVLYACLIMMSIWKKKYRWKAAAASLAAVAGYLPWFSVLVRSFRRTASDWWPTEIPGIKECFVSVFGHAWMAPVVILSFLAFALHAARAPEWKRVGSLAFVCMGFLSAAVTAAVGLALSYAMRPFFLARYLWPASAMLFVAFGQSLSGLKLKTVWCAALAALFLLMDIPGYCSICLWDMELDMATADFQENVPLGASDMIVTNNAHHAWSIAAYYYPGTPVAGISRDMGLDAGSRHIWLFWTKELDDGMAAWLDGHGKAYEYRYQGCLGNDNRLFVYSVYDKGSRR